MNMDIRIFADLDALSSAALQELLKIMNEAVKLRGRFAIALAGGHTPARLYSLWARAEGEGLNTPWDRVHLFWGDERYVPHNDPLSNYRMARDALITRVPIPDSNVHPMPTADPLPENSARAYESGLRAFFGAVPPAFDLQLLGLGPEGHTASLFPGSPLLTEKRRWVAPVKVSVNPSRRLTLTPAVLNLGRNTFFLVSGKDKRGIVSALRAESGQEQSNYPAARIQPTGAVLWFLDEAAAG